MFLIPHLPKLVLNEQAPLPTLFFYVGPTVKHRDQLDHDESQRTKLPPTTHVFVKVTPLS